MFQLLGKCLESSLSSLNRLDTVLVSDNHIGAQRPAACMCAGHSVLMHQRQLQEECLQSVRTTDVPLAATVATTARTKSCTAPPPSTGP